MARNARLRLQAAALTETASEPNGKIRELFDQITIGERSPDHHEWVMYESATLTLHYYVAKPSLPVRRIPGVRR